MERKIERHQVEEIGHELAAATAAQMGEAVAADVSKRFIEMDSPLISEERLFKLREELRDIVRKQEQLCLEGHDTTDPELLRLAHQELVLRDTIRALSALQ